MSRLSSTAPEQAVRVATLSGATYLGPQAPRHDPAALLQSVRGRYGEY